MFLNLIIGLLAIAYLLMGMYYDANLYHNSEEFTRKKK